MRTPRLLRDPGRPHPRRGGHRHLPGHVSLYRLRPSLLDHLQRHPGLLETRRYHRGGRGHQLRRASGDPDLTQLRSLVQTQRCERLGASPEGGRQRTEREATDATIHRHRGSVGTRGRRGRPGTSGRAAASLLRSPAASRPRLTSSQVDLKFRYKFRLILDETSSFGVLGRTGRGVTEAQNVDVSDVDMIVASLAGALCAAGGFCAGSDAIVEHQRITSAAYTFSAALPAMLATAASEALIRLQTDPDLIGQLQLNVRAMRAQLDPRSEWVCCTSSVSNPIMLLVLKPALVSARAWTVDDQDRLLQDVVDEVRLSPGDIVLSPPSPPISSSSPSPSSLSSSLPSSSSQHAPTNRLLFMQTLANGVLITHLKRIPSTTTPVGRRDPNHWQPSPALKVCVTVGLSRKEIEKAGVIIRHAITKVVSRRK